MLIRIREGRPDDAAAVAHLIAQHQAQLTDDPTGAGAEAFLASVSAQAERGYLESERHRYWVAEQGGALAGFIAMRDRTHVFHLFVARDHQGRGLARRLWAAARQALGLDDPALRLTVNASRAAVPVYAAWGFVPSQGLTQAHGITFQPMHRPPVGDAEGAPG